MLIPITYRFLRQRADDAAFITSNCVSERNPAHLDQAESGTYCGGNEVLAHYVAPSLWVPSS
jgi:hypothetical protein